MRTAKGAILCAIILSLIVANFGAANAEGDITAVSTGFERTTIIQFDNTGTAEIETFRLWLESGVAFKSFKTEKGWTGTKSPHGVLIFTAATPVKAGESVKFGIKADAEKPGINWRALDGNGGQLASSKTAVSDIPDVPENAVNQTIPATSEDGILEGSSFRLIPERPNPGSSVRVTGENFGANQELDLFMGEKKLDTFETDGSGHFMFTSDIPDEDAESVDFIIKDKSGNDKMLSISLGQMEAEAEEIKFSIQRTSESANRGEMVSIGGTGDPGGSVTMTITDPGGRVITTDVAKINGDGIWTYETIIPLDAPLGMYSAIIGDGRSEETIEWVIESDQKIHVTPVMLKFEPGETMIFNGTAIPGQNMEVIIENPQGAEVYSDIIAVSPSGEVGFEYTTGLADLEGTYIIYLTQSEHATTILVGLGELPEAQLIVKVEKLNYRSSEIARVDIDGPPSSTVTLRVLDQSDKEQFSDSVVLGQNGKREYDLKLREYKSGSYTIVATRGQSHADDVFAVGLNIGAGPVSIQTTKAEYHPRDPVLVLGESDKNILITLALVDPNGNQIKLKELFTNKLGKISEDTFRIPNEAESGTWKIIARSGSNQGVAEFEVIRGAQDGIVVKLGETEQTPVGEVLNIRVLGAQSSIILEIYSESGEQIERLDLGGSTADRPIPWTIPPDLEAGSYIIVARDNINRHNATYVHDE